MKLIRYIFALLSLGFLIGCSSDSNEAKPSRLVKFSPTAKFAIHWHRTVGKIGVNLLLPAATTSSVLAANSSNEIWCFELRNGEVRWHVNVGFAIAGGIDAEDGLILVGGDKGEVSAYEEATGKLRWHSKVSSEVLSAPKLADGVVVVRSGDGRIAGLDENDGKQLWLYERVTPALVARNTASVTIHNGIVYAGFAAGKLSAIGLHNGVTVWESSVSQPRGNTELERISDIITPPIVDDRQVCAVAFQGRLACYDATQGGSMWSRDISSDNGLSISRKYLYITDFSSDVFGLDKLSGSSYWKNGQLSHRQVTAPLPLDNYLLLGDYQGYIHALNREDGSMVARMNTDGSAIRTPPIQAGDGFVALTSYGSLYYVSIQ